MYGDMCNIETSADVLHLVAGHIKRIGIYGRSLGFKTSIRADLRQRTNPNMVNMRHAEHEYGETW